MDDLLDKLLTRKIDKNDVIEWLKSNETSIPELRSFDKSELIPNIIDFIKNKCAWICNSVKTNDLICNEKTTPSSPISSVNATIDKQVHQRTPSPSLYRTIKKDSPTNCTDRRNSNPLEDKTKPQKEVKRVQVITLGCTPYKQKGSSFNVRYPSKSPDYKNFDDFPSMGNNKNYSTQFGPTYYNSNQSIENKVVNQYNKINFARVCDNVPKPCVNKLNSDAFPPLGVKGQETKTRRRITPTPIQTANNYESKFGKSNFASVSERNQCQSAFKTSTLQESDPGLQQERELLKVTKNMFNKPLTVFEKSSTEKSITEVKHVLLKQVDSFVNPDPDKVTMMDQILSVSDIYSCLLCNRLVPNVTSELYFLLELITSKVSAEENHLNEEGIFASIHNCVYFAVSVLGSYGKLLQMLDKATLTSMESLPYLIKFSPQLFNYLQICIYSKQDVSPLLPSLTGVPFQVEDDSKANFPDEYTFVCFKRQRDLFYEMLREWHENMTLR